LVDITPAPRYSICITNYNTRETIRGSLQSILDQVDSSFEIVVCDNCSTDGSREILEEYASKAKLRLIVERSTRGRGRQIAFNKSKGDWILSGFDMDDVFRPTLKDILKMYHEKHEGYVLSFGTVHIIPRAIVEEVGGWKDLQWGEDVDFCRRVESISKLHYFDDSSPLVMKKGHVRRGTLQRIRNTYALYQTRYRIGIKVFRDIERNPWYERPLLFLIAIGAVMTCRLKGVRKFRYK
jgi:glycosyltransferase involved in cell wall biosynthesis